MKIGIAGAGLVGRLLAFQLARAGHAVDVFDPAAHAEARGAAGWAAAGMLCPVAELQCADEHVFAQGLRSLELWPRIAAQLDVAVEVRREGSLLFAHRGDEGAAARTIDFLTGKAPAGYEPQPLSMEQAKELEPAVQGPAHAWLLPGEGSLHTVQAMQALASTASAAGARWHWGRSVETLEAGALWVGGQRHGFDWVFDARGLGARPDLPVRGVRGEVFTLHAPGVSLRRPLRLLHARHAVYLVPRTGDQVVVGASSIESEDRSPVSVRTTVELLAAAHSLVPALAEARIVLAQANLRPALPDNLPRVETQAGLTRVNGLYRHGWLIAPAMVEEALQALP
ncbi:MAG: FAD-dependent oxidoreductase [Ramlibacter sp.]|nr:FAD-dependent oxidoreductase [Ramlibacter sp.]